MAVFVSDLKTKIVMAFLFFCLCQSRATNINVNGLVAV